MLNFHFFHKVFRFNTFITSMNKSNFLPNGLKVFFKAFEEDLSKPHFINLKSWTAGILEGHSSVYEIKESFSEKHVSSLTRFMNESPWDHKSLNHQRITWASNILSIRYHKYYPIIIDDTVNRKYGSLLTGVGRYYSNSEKRIIQSQTIVSSHMYLGTSDIPLFVDIYQKKDKIDDLSKFRTKIDMAMEHIEKAPKIKGRIGVVIVDTWYSSNSMIKKIIEEGYEGIIALKSNRTINFKGKKISVSELAKLKEDDFEKITVEGKVYQSWTSKVTLPGISNKLTNKPQKFRISISKQLMKNKNWTDYKYLLLTDLSMGKWTGLYLYQKRWKIETFYRFAKNAFDFQGSQIRSEVGAIRYFTLLFFAYTYLTLSKYPHFAISNDAKTHYQAKKELNKETMENIVDWIHSQTMEGVDLEEIKLKLGL